MIVHGFCTGLILEKPSLILFGNTRVQLEFSSSEVKIVFAQEIGHWVMLRHEQGLTSFQSIDVDSWLKDSPLATFQPSRQKSRALDSQNWPT